MFFTTFLVISFLYSIRCVRRRFVALKQREAEYEKLEREQHQTVEDWKQMTEQWKSTFYEERDRWRRLQHRIQHELEPEVAMFREEVQSLKHRRGFVLVLIDADGDGYIKGEAGGRSAAIKLLKEIRKYLLRTDIDVANTDVVVRVYGNLRGLSGAGVEDGRTVPVTDLELFVDGFSSQQPLFEFINVGLEAKASFQKFRGMFEALHRYRLPLKSLPETFKFHINDIRCKHVVLGICHKPGYIPFVEEFADDTSVYDRITLLLGYQCSPSYPFVGITNFAEFRSVFVVEEGPGMCGDSGPADAN
ncbi:MAG: hypothetical protein Q9179_006708 [Wetmoreana sp. 5 TL-2023]